MDGAPPEGCFAETHHVASMFTCGVEVSSFATATSAVKFSPVTTTIRRAASRWRTTGVGGWLGALMLKRVNEKALRVGGMAIGVALTIGLFIKAP